VAGAEHNATIKRILTFLLPFHESTVTVTFNSFLDDDDNLQIKILCKIPIWGGGEEEVIS
jgi:hypothetical protein